jgi:hypothetical protein
MFAPPLYYSHELPDNHFSDNSSPEAFLLKSTALVQESYAQNKDFNMCRYHIRHLGAPETSEGTFL